MTQNFVKQFDGSNVQKSVQEDWFGTQENSKWDEGVGIHYYQYYFQGCDPSDVKPPVPLDVWTGWRAGGDDDDDDDDCEGFSFKSCNECF